MSSFTNRLISGLYKGTFNRLNAAAPHILYARRALLWFTSIYSLGILFRLHLLDWGASEGPSMYPTMPTQNLFTFHKRLSTKNVVDSTPSSSSTTTSPDPSQRKLKIGDIVYFNSPIFEGQMANKRIIGMPGDYVVRDHALAPSVGDATVRGITDFQTDEEIATKIELKERNTEPEMIRVPEGHIWVAGDNMAWSRDSRFYGPVPMALIDGITVAGAEGLFTWSFYGNAMRKIPKDQEEWVLDGRPARFVGDKMTTTTTNKDRDTILEKGRE